MNRSFYRHLFLFALVALLLPVFALAGQGSGSIQVQPNVDILIEGFEAPSNTPAGWHKIHLGNSWGWGRTSSQSQSGNASFYVRPGSSGYNQDEYLVTPALDFSYHIAPKLTWHEDEVDWVSNGGTHYVMVSTTSQTDPATFEVVAEMTPANHTINGFGSDTPAEVDLSAYAGMSEVYVAMRYVGSAQDYWYIDDFKVLELVGAGGDVLPSSVSPDGESFGIGDLFTPTAVVYNNGTDSADLEVTMEILENDVLVRTETTEIVGLASDGSQTVTFAEYAAGSGLIELRCTTTMEGDQIPSNDVKSVFNTAYSQPHVPMGILFTNAGCGPCVSANVALDNVYPTLGNDAALARIHVSWPGADGMYSANSAQSNAMVSEYGVGGVPSFFIDGAPSSNFYHGFQDAMQSYSPMDFDLSFDPDTQELTVTLNVNEMMAPLPNLKVYAYITEDNVYYAGGNGETHHSQAMRYIYPNTTGLDVDTSLGSHTYVLDTHLNSSWAYDELRATVYIQNKDNNQILQAGTDFLTNIEGSGVISAAGDLVTAALHLNANYPNPFNPSTKISFNLPRDEHAEISIYALDGKLVKTLVSETMTQGPHDVVWAGKDASGASVASGAYFYRLKTPSFSETRVMTLIK